MRQERGIDMNYKVVDFTFKMDDVDNREFLCELVKAMYEELPAPKKKKN